jgi:hypothetical protein
LRGGDAYSICTSTIPYNICEAAEVKFEAFLGRQPWQIVILLTAKPNEYPTQLWMLDSHAQNIQQKFLVLYTDIQALGGERVQTFHPLLPSAPPLMA